MSGPSTDPQAMSRKFVSLIHSEVRNAMNDELREKFDAGEMTKRDLRMSVARRCGVEHITDEFKEAVAAGVDIVLKELEATLDADEREETQPKKKQKVTPKASGGKLVDRAGVEAKVRDEAEEWDITEKPRANSLSKHADRYYKKKGDTKTYRSLVEVARAYYPQFLDQGAAK